MEKRKPKYKKVRCTACNGSGYYDSTNSPKCGCCNGTGKMKVTIEEYEEYQKFLKGGR